MQSEIIKEPSALEICFITGKHHDWANNRAIQRAALFGL